MRRASPPGPAPGEMMRDPLTPPSDYVDHAAARRIVVGVLLTMLLAALDQVMVATALPSIAASLGDVDNMSWVVTANLLCATAATPLYGKLSDIHGRRAMMLIAIGVYAAGSLACALAPSMLTLILGRALQGLGGGGLMPLVQTIIGDVASPRDRPRYQAYTSSTFIISTVGGPILGGFIAEHFHWSWIFWFNLPLCGLAFLFTHNVLQRLPRHDRRHEFDVLGAVLMVGAAVPLLLALTWGGRRYGWGSPQILALFVACATLWSLFAWRMLTAKEPFIPVSVLRDGAMRVGTAAAFFAVGVVIALTIVLPLYAQLALGLSVSESGWTIIALQGGATLSSVVGGRLLVRCVHSARNRADWIFARRCARPDRASRARIGADVPIHGCGGAKCGRAPPTRRRHRHDEFLSCARLDFHGLRLRRDRARGRAGDARDVGGRGAGGNGCGRGLSVGFRGRHCLPDGGAHVHSRAQGAGAARLLATEDAGRITRRPARPRAAWPGGGAASGSNRARAGNVIPALCASPLPS